MEEENLQVNKKSGNFKKALIIIFSILFAFGALLIISVVMLLIIGFNEAQKEAEVKYNQVQINKEASEDKPLSAIDKIANTLAYAYFEDYEITEDENKFYVHSKDWKYANFNERKQMMTFATLKALSFREKAGEHPIGEEEKEKTKIYDYETKQLLGEFHMDKKVDPSAGIMESALAEIKAYKFYEVEE